MDVAQLSPSHAIAGDAPESGTCHDNHPQVNATREASAQLIREAQKRHTALARQVSAPPGPLSLSVCAVGRARDVGGCEGHHTGFRLSPAAF